MAGVILENVSTKKLVAICIFLLGLSLSCFIIGGTVVPPPVHSQTASANWCIAKADGNTELEWYPSRGTDVCDKVDGINDPRIKNEEITSDQIRFSFQYPLPRDGRDLKMDRLFMYHLTVLSFNIEYHDEIQPEEGALIGMQVRVGYKDNSTNSWTLLAEGEVIRSLHCHPLPQEQQKTGYRYDCDFVDFFEIGSMHHDQYLVNVKMPPNFDTGHNTGIGALTDVDLVWFAATGGFTTSFLILKTISFAMVLPLAIWNWKRVHDLNRPAVFLEKLLLGLAFAAIILNFPIDWFVLVVELKFMLIWSDIRQGLFLTVLLIYWLIFTGEHMVDDVKRGEWTSYWKQLATVILASVLMFLFDICERGVRLANPFFSLWSTSEGTTLGKAFIGIAIASSIIYSIILLVFIVKAIYNIWKKRSVFHSMAKGLRIHYMSIIYRFFFTLIFTAVCCVLTVVALGMGQVYESQWRWEDDFEREEEIDPETGDEVASFSVGPSLKKFQINTAFQFGVYGTWNVYVMAMLIFYAPSHKPESSVAIDDEDEHDETVELTTVSSGVRTRSRTAASAASIEQTDEVTDETTTLTGSSAAPTRHEVVSHIHTLANKSVVD